MCGIAGWYRFDKSKKGFAPEQVGLCIEETHSRGGDSVGIYSPSAGVVKTPGTAKEFVDKQAKEIHTASLDRLCLIHNRRAASGKASAPPTKNENNHPHESKDWVLIHNGILHDSPAIKDYKYNGTCDSEIALSYLQEFGLDGLEMLCDDDGFALAFVDKRSGEMYLIRHKNPVVYGYDHEKDALLFGSTVDIVTPLADESEQRGIRCLSSSSWWNLTENHLYCVSHKGIEDLGAVEFVRTKWLYEERAKKDEKFQRLEEVKKVERYSSGSQMGFSYGGGAYGETGGGGRGWGTRSERGSSAGYPMGLDPDRSYIYTTEGGVIYATV